MDYYTILDLNENCTKEEIKKKYRELCLIYHPDKNNGDDKQFKKINEAYEILYDDEKRKKYNVSLLFKNIEFTEEDYELLEKYYQQFVNSNEFKLMKLLYDSIPDSVKKDIWERFKKCTSKEIVKSQKTIDITQLYKNMVINLLLKSSDYENRTLKIIHIITRNGIYYLYLREYYDFNIDNDGCFLHLHFYVRDYI
tara:strand:+ start:16693 stop:17280 length:588 start_codon:yes stop_codon:yes gene_type:complete